MKDLKNINILHVIFSSLPDIALFVFDSELRYIFVECGPVFNLDAKLIKGHTFRDIVGPRVLKIYEPYYEKTLMGEYCTPDDYHDLQNDKHYRVNFMPYKHEHGAFGVIVVRDITEYMVLFDKERDIKAEAFLSAANRFGAEMSRTALEIFQLANALDKRTGSTEAKEIQDKASKQLTELRDLHLISGSYHPNITRSSLRSVVIPLAQVYNIPVSGADVDVLIDVSSFTRAMEYLLENTHFYGKKNSGSILIYVESGVPILEISNHINGNYSGSGLPYFSPYGGRGLGLNIAHAVIEKNNGTMQITVNDNIFRVRITLKA